MTSDAEKKITLSLNMQSYRITYAVYDMNPDIRIHKVFIS